jgi:hypothetical protein
LSAVSGREPPTRRDIGVRLSGVVASTFLPDPSSIQGPLTAVGLD